MVSLKEKTVKGLLWGAINNGVQQVLVLVFGIVLGRLLSPSEYGMVGMLTIFTLIGTSLQESGFRAALANVRHIRHEDYNAVFWCSLCIGVGTYLVLFFCAPLIARFYDDPALTALARYCFLAIPIAGLGTAQGAYLFRNLKVRQQALSGIIAHLVSGCLGIVLAFNGFSYWGIATQSLTYLVIVTLCCWHFSPWRPTFHVDFRPLGPLFGFSSRLLITNITNQLNNNLLSVILGKCFSAQAVGNYNQANKWNAMGHQFITGMIGSVAQPVLAGISDDRARSLHIFRKILRFCAFLAFPAMFGLSTVTHELILLTVGPKWTGCIPLMQLLCIGGAFVPLNTLFANLVISRGRSDIYMWNIIAQVLIQLAAVGILIGLGGDLYVMVIVCVCVNILWLFVWSFFAGRFIGFGVKALASDLLPFSLTAMLACLAGRGIAYLAGDPLPATFFIKAVVAAGCYLLVMKLARSVTMQECINYICKRK